MFLKVLELPCTAGVLSELHFRNAMNSTMWRCKSMKTKTGRSVFHSTASYEAAGHLHGQVVARLFIWFKCYDSSAESIVWFWNVVVMFRWQVFCSLSSALVEIYLDHWNWGVKQIDYPDSLQSWRTCSSTSLSKRPSIDARCLPPAFTAEQKQDQQSNRVFVINRSGLIQGVCFLISSLVTGTFDSTKDRGSYKIFGIRSCLGIGHLNQVNNEEVRCISTKFTTLDFNHSQYITS